MEEPMADVLGGMVDEHDLSMVLDALAASCGELVGPFWDRWQVRLAALAAECRAEE